MSHGNGTPHNAHTRVILVGAPEADRTLRRDPRIELVRAPDVFHALGELSAPDTSPAPPPTAVVLGTAALSTMSISSVSRAIRTLDPFAKILALTDGKTKTTRTPDAHWVSEQHIADAIFDDAPPPEAPAETFPETPAHEKPIADVLDDEPSSKKKKKKKKNKAPKASHAPSSPPPIQDDERVTLRTILTGEDILPELLIRAKNALDNDRVEFIRALENEDQPEIVGGFTAIKVVRRSHVFGWLVGPLELAVPLADQAEVMALWLSLADQHEQLRGLAFTDALTGAWNRRYFDKYLASAICEARRKRHNLTLMVFDIDNFKLYNDEYGHAAGDEILIETIRLLKSHVRPQDRVCRIGGDEFAVVFYDPSDRKSVV